MRAVLFLYFLLLCTSISSKGITHSFPTEPMCIAATLKSETSFLSMRNARAVLDVIRTRMHKTGQSACKVVLANKQFSGMTMKKVVEIDRKSLTQTVRVANMAPVCKRCEFFHAEWVRPTWRKQMVLHKKIDGHLFYRTKERV